MTSDERPHFRSGRIVPTNGQPLEVTGSNEITSRARSAKEDLARKVGLALRAHKRALRGILQNAEAEHADYLPAHLREDCSLFVLHCEDGIFVRYDPIKPGDKPSLQTGEVTGDGDPAKCTLEWVVPKCSENIVHVLPDPSKFRIDSSIPSISVGTFDTITGEKKPGVKLHPVVLAKPQFAEHYVLPKPPSRPPYLASVGCETELGIEGILAPKEDGSYPGDAKRFLAHGEFRLPVGWLAIEIYPILPADYWKEEYAEIWAQLDFHAAIARKNLNQNKLRALDSRAELRKKYKTLLEEFEALLGGKEEPVHQFLKQHPELLFPTSDKYWSKLKFGERVSDFVFREQHNEYVLVEIEAPIRELFRQDGQQREELTHAINQIADWTEYIGNNKRIVEETLGLTGISVTPRSLVVIGRSSILTDANRAKLTTIQNNHPKLRILTYDDVLANARTCLEHIVGPLDYQSSNFDLYFFQ
ncbi:MAG: DUF4263 domain-containing protein [Candidatus Obscuribacterales bacterium]|jgi:hypothetical protein|nr:DUF4263 domain-containing protein [Candidatus Obscuribacterales bacterium]